MPEPDSGDSAWILTSSALVLLMTLPGLALFYGGLVRAKNFLSVLVQCGAIAAMASVIWIAVGYSLAFSVNGNSYIGSPENFMFNGLLDSVREDQTIGELAFALFQMTFAIITPALIVGAWVERARFGWVVAFSALWSLLVYIPVTRWVWGGGFLAEQGVIDFAGGIVVHTTAGISALVVALMLGKRIGFPKTLMLPHSPALTVAGAGLLWVGWFGFNGGSALAASDAAASAIINTHVAASVAALVWILIERFKVGKSTAVGFATGAVAGLATITPAAGTVGPGGAIIIGLLAGLVCFWCVGLVKGTLKIDDSLDVFAVHGVGGMLGSLLLAIFASESFGGVGYAEGAGMGSQLWVQLKGVAIVAVYSAVVTLIIGYMVSMVLPMRVSEDQERDGLDISSHGERAWDLD
ncbi:MAG TPA: ammonium transporter [Sphingorhabdus lacus]|nr:ammonium transporter [Sphingorhabdus lacus]